METDKIDVQSALKTQGFLSLLPTEIKLEISDYMDIFDFVSFLSSHKTQINNKEVLLKEKLTSQLNSRTIFERARFVERYFKKFKIKLTFSDTEIEIEEQIRVDQDYRSLKNVFGLNYKVPTFRFWFYNSGGEPESESIDKTKWLRIDGCYNYNLPIDYPTQINFLIKKKSEKNKIFTYFENYNNGIDPFNISLNQNLRVSFVFA